MRILLLALGVASTFLALQAFYFRPWLGGTSRLDGWLARNGCAIGVLCTPPINLRNQMGVLAALAAVLCFGLAFYRWQGAWADQGPAAIRLPLSWTSGRMWTALLLSLLSLATVAYQGYQVVSGEVPRVVVWLLGIAGFLAAAVVLDASYLPDLFRTGAAVSWGGGSQPPGCCHSAEQPLLPAACGPDAQDLRSLPGNMSPCWFSRWPR